MGMISSRNLRISNALLLKAGVQDNQDEKSSHPYTYNDVYEGNHCSNEVDFMSLFLGGLTLFMFLPRMKVATYSVMEIELSISHNAQDYIERPAAGKRK
jgi:hypothetical protein